MSMVRTDEKKCDTHIYRNLRSPSEALRKERDFLCPGKSDLPIFYIHIWIGVGAEFCPSPAAPMCKLLKHLWGDAVFVSSPGNISQSLEGFEFYISDLSVYGKTDQIIAHNSNTFQDNCDWWTESTQKESINYDSEIVIKEDRMRLLAGETVATLPPNNTRA